MSQKIPNFPFRDFDEFDEIDEIDELDELDEEEGISTSGFNEGDEEELNYDEEEF